MSISLFVIIITLILKSLFYWLPLTASVIWEGNFMERRTFLKLATGFIVAGTFVQKGYATVINSRVPW